jgi:hypothetical protein
MCAPALMLYVPSTDPDVHDPLHPINMVNRSTQVLSERKWFRAII